MFSKSVLPFGITSIISVAWEFFPSLWCIVKILTCESLLPSIVWTFPNICIGAIRHTCKPGFSCGADIHTWGNERMVNCFFLLYSELTCPPSNHCSSLRRTPGFYGSSPCKLFAYTLISTVLLHLSLIRKALVFDHLGKLIHLLTWSVVHFK